MYSRNVNDVLAGRAILAVKTLYTTGAAYRMGRLLDQENDSLDVPFNEAGAALIRKAIAELKVENIRLLAEADKLPSEAVYRWIGYTEWGATYLATRFSELLKRFPANA